MSSPHSSLSDLNSYAQPYFDGAAFDWGKGHPSTGSTKGLGKSGIYRDVEGGHLYVNVGTAESPTWNLWQNQSTVSVNMGPVGSFLKYAENTGTGSIIGVGDSIAATLFSTTHRGSWGNGLLPLTGIFKLEAGGDSEAARNVDHAYCYRNASTGLASSDWVLTVQPWEDPSNDSDDYEAYDTYGTSQKFTVDSGSAPGDEHDVTRFGTVFSSQASEDLPDMTYRASGTIIRGWMCGMVGDNPPASMGSKLSDSADFGASTAYEEFTVDAAASGEIGYWHHIHSSSATNASTGAQAVNVWLCAPDIADTPGAHIWVTAGGIFLDQDQNPNGVWCGHVAEGQMLSSEYAQVKTAAWKSLFKAQLECGVRRFLVPMISGINDMAASDAGSVVAGNNQTWISNMRTAFNEAVDELNYKDCDIAFAVLAMWDWASPGPVFDETDQILEYNWLMANYAAATSDVSFFHTLNHFEWAQDLSRSEYHTEHLEGSSNSHPDLWNATDDLDNGSGYIMDQFFTTARATPEYTA